MRHLGNDELFRLYDSELVLRLHNAKNLGDTRRMLSSFKDYLGDYPLSPELAKAFLAQYADRKPRTLYRYAHMIRVFMKWYGEPMNDFRIRVPKTLPPYTEDSDVDRLLAAIENKKTHKDCVPRDLLLAELALKSGMRRGELANLEAKDVHADFLVGLRLIRRIGTDPQSLKNCQGDHECASVRRHRLVRLNLEVMPSAVTMTSPCTSVP